jgi:branched-chain amino acid transport system substrate-binding protein
MKRRTLIGAAAAMTTAAAVWGQENQGNAWRIARSLPLSGPQSAYGEAKRDGGDAFAAMANARGGVRGRRLVIHTADDGYDEKRTAANVADLAAAHAPVAFAGFFGAPQCAAAAEALVKLGVSGVGFTTGSNAFREKPQREIFPVRASFPQEAAAIVKHHKTTGVQEAVIAFVDIPFGQLARTSFERAAAAEGLRLLPAVSIQPNGGNMRAASAALHATSAVVLMALHTPAAVGLTRELRALHSLQQLWCLSAVDSAVLQKQLGTAVRGVASSVVVPAVGKQRVAVVREYMAATQALGRPATTYGLEAFIEMKVLAQGLARQRGEGPRDLVASLEGSGRMDLGGFDLSYGPGDRTGSRYVDLVMITSSAVVE